MGTRHLLAAAQAAGVQRFVAQSYTGWTNERRGGPVKTETDPFDPEPAKEPGTRRDFPRRCRTAATITATVDPSLLPMTASFIARR